MDDVFVTAKQVCARYGNVCEMTLHRWLKSPALAFPRPIRINRVRFWRLADLEAWETAQAEREAA